MAESKHPPESRIASLATTQHGVVASWQLRRLGCSNDMVSDRVAKGLLHRLHRGVYLVGHRRISQKGRWMAAVLACGPEAVLSHHAAVALWELRPASRGPIDVTVPGRSRHGRSGIKVHRVRNLVDGDHTIRDGIPVTSLARTLLDYTDDPQELRLALEAAERLGLLNVGEIDALIAHSPGRRTRPLRAALAELGATVPWTRSELERRFLALIRRHGLPAPSANVLVAGHLVDFHWPEHDLVVELDGYQYHHSRRAFERDREQDAALQLARQRVLRVTHRRVGEPSTLLSQLRALLGAASDL